MKVSQKELARFFRKDVRTIRRWTDAGMPREPDGTYRTSDCVEWRLRDAAQEAVARFEAVDYQEAKARREHARAGQEEIKLAREEGRVVAREAVEQVFGEQLMDVLRATLLNIPGRHGAQMGFDSPREGEAALKRVVTEVLEELSGPVADSFVASPDAELADDFPGRKALGRAGIDTLPDLLDVEDLLSVRGVGPKTEAAIRARLEEMGLAA